MQGDFAQIFKELKNSSGAEISVGSNIENAAIENSSMENLSAKRDSVATIERTSIDNMSKVEAEPAVGNLSIRRASKEERDGVRVGIHSTSIRIVREELTNAMKGQSAAEIKIGDIVPLTGLTRRTVDRVCKYLEKTGQFSFERLHRGMRVTRHE